MSRQAILAATDNAKAIEFLTAYFSETESIPTVVRSKSDLSVFFSCEPDVVFFQGDWVDRRVASRLVQFKSGRPKLKCFSLGTVRQDGFDWDGGIDLPIDEKA